MFRPVLEIGSSSSTNDTPVMTQTDSRILGMIFTPSRTRRWILSLVILIKLLRIPEKYEVKEMLDALQFCFLIASRLLIVICPYEVLGTERLHTHKAGDVYCGARWCQEIETAVLKCQNTFLIVTDSNRRYPLSLGSPKILNALCKYESTYAN
jgi:hypothetical protein